MFNNLHKIIIILVLFMVNAYAETFSDYSITGNQRVSSQTIFNFSKLEIGVDVSKDDINDALRNIYETSFFEEVSVNIKNNTLNIIVKEYPIIRDIEFNGIKAKKFIKILRERSTLKPKSSFNKFTLQKDLNQISNILRQSGYYFSKVDLQQKTNSDNTINIIYNVTMGEKALINKIKFIGKKKFKSSKLISVIVSEENKFWKFLSKNKYLDKNRTELDKRLLQNFYRNRGYYNVKVEEVYTQIVNEKNFSLTYKINSGKKFLFNTFEILIPDDYEIKDFDKLKKVFKNLENSTYSYKSIDAILSEIDKIAGSENYEFIDVIVVETIEGEDKINFTFNIKEGDKFYVERINILGNNITNEQFIRQKIITDEGDPFNKLLHNKTINNLKSTNVFKSVKTEIIDGSAKGLKIIDISVEEKPTGEISAGAGYGSSGSTIAIGIKENNFKGDGVKLDANLKLRQDSIQGRLSYTHPNFAYSDRALTTSIESSSLDKEKEYGYKSSLNEITLGASFEQYENMFFAPRISISSETLKTTSTASANYKKQEGSYFDTLLSYSLTYNTLNSSFKPTDGYVSSISQEIPLISDGYAIINGYQVTQFKEVMNDEAVWSMGLFTRAVNSLQSDQDVRVSKRLYLPQSKLRGFEAGKIGPKDGLDFVGGNYMASFNTSLTLPFLFPTFDKVDFLLFFDAANLWHADYSKKINQGNKIRSSTGLAVEVVTPIGPLSFSLSQPITKDDGDMTESFRFNLGTTF